MISLPFPSLPLSLLRPLQVRPEAGNRKREGRGRMDRINPPVQAKLN